MIYKICYCSFEMSHVDRMYRACAEIHRKPTQPANECINIQATQNVNDLCSRLEDIYELTDEDILEIKALIQRLAIINKGGTTTDDEVIRLYELRSKKELEYK